MTTTNTQKCTCYPCTSPAWGHPSVAHCAACCGGTGILEYDHDCPIKEHKEWAAIQFPKNLGTTINKPDGSHQCDSFTCPEHL